MEQVNTGRERRLGGARNGLLATALAVGSAIAMAGTALAATVGAGAVVNLDGGLTNQPPACEAGQTRLAHFILTGLDAGDQAALTGVIVTATFNNGATVIGTGTGALTVQGANLAANIPVPGTPPANNTVTVSAATFTTPSPLPASASGSIDYNNFNVSGGSCADAPPPPPPSNTPELSSVALFGSGALGLVGFAAMRLRRRRQA